MPARRNVLVLAGSAALALALPIAPRRAAAALSTDEARQFVQATAAKMVAVINGPGALTSRQQEVAPVLDAAVDVDGIARFCLGRFWRQATPQQQEEYVRLFRAMLLNSLAARLGDYRGVGVTVDRAEQRPDGIEVSSVVMRPNHPPAAVIWVVGDVNGQPRIVDLTAEGTSLRLTQRGDYASYLSRNGNQVAAVIAALRQQVGRT